MKSSDAQGADLVVGLTALRHWGDRYLCARPMRLLRRESDGTPVVAALVPKGAPVRTNHEIELVPGPGFPAEEASAGV